MKLKNIEVGDWIVAKNVHGGEHCYSILEIGKSYQVVDIGSFGRGDNENKLDLYITGADHPNFNDGFAVSHKYFKKPKSSKLKQLKKRVKALENCCDNLDRLTTELNHSLPNPIEIYPKPKQLTQAVFEGQSRHLKWAAIEEDGSIYLFAKKPFIDLHKWAAGIDEIEFYIEDGYDTSDWQNSLIERESVELAGSDLCRAMLARGDKHVMCAVGGQARAVIVERFNNDIFYTHHDTEYLNPKPINNQGEPLTASDVGLGVSDE